MTERWRKPVIPLAIEPTTETLVTIRSDGDREVRTMHDYEFVLSEEDVERIRTGYVCIWCQEPFEVPFPKNCSLCGFECKDRQAEMFARQYRGGAPELPSLIDKIAALDERDAREAYVPGSSIWLPNSLKEGT